MLQKRISNTKSVEASAFVSSKMYFPQHMNRGKCLVQTNITLCYNICQEVILMEDKLFDLMTQMYGELKDFKKEVNERFDAVDQRFDDSDKKVDNLSNQFVRFENEIKQDISALYDAYKLTYEKVCVVDKKVDILNNKVEKQEIEMRVIKGA